MLHADASLARRIETAECGLLVGFAEAARKRGEDVLIAPIAGGVAIFAGADAPFTKVAGLGFGGAIDEQQLARVEQEFERHGTKLQVEFSSLGDGGISAMLSARGYRLIGFENVLGRRIGAARSAATQPFNGSAIGVSLAAADETRTWLDVVVTGFEHPDRFDGPPSHESFSRETIERVLGDSASVPGLRLYLARLDGVVAGGASLRLTDRVAQLCGAATLPAHRRRGVQTALLNARLADAGDAGCDIAVVTVQPGSKSQENAHRQGFELLYARAILVREWRRAAL